MQFANKGDEEKFQKQLDAIAEKVTLLDELETQHGIRSAEDFDRWWRETKGNWEREIALLKSQLIQAHHLNAMKMEEFMSQFTLECVKVAPAEQKAARMEKALLAIKEIVEDMDGPYDCGWDTFDQIHDALNEGLKEKDDVQEG